MRKYTLVCSIVAHAVAVGTMIIVPALATEELPEPRRTSEFIIVKPEMPVPPVVRQQSAKAAPSMAIPVPLSPPERIQPEPIVEPRDPGALDFGASPTGVPVSDFVSGGEPVPPPPPIPSLPKEPVHVGGRIEAPTKLVHVNPIYPPLPLAARKEGLVILEALIAEDGTVRDVKVLRRAPLFEESAIAAVRQWRFSPTLLNGEPVPIVMTVTVGFTLER
jgi:protein TonB